MERTNNYRIQAQQAKERFVTYEQSRLIAKLKLRFDETYLYVPMLRETYRIHRKTGDISRENPCGWAVEKSDGFRSHVPPESAGRKSRPLGRKIPG